MKKIEDLQTAQQYIVKNYKHYRKIVVLRNAEAVPYTLFAETEEGIVQVSLEEAAKYKKIHISWNKKR